MISRRNLNILALNALAFFFLAIPAHAGEVVTASPSWEAFTSREGQGLYHDLLRAIYEPRGETLRHLEVPAKRGLVMVREGQADIYTCLPDVREKLLLAELPMYEGEFHALFRASTFPDWDGVRSLANKRVVWRLGYYTPKNFPVPIHHSETTSGIEALQRLVRGGADVYVDDRNLILESMHAFPTRLEEGEFRIEAVGFRQYFPAFSTSERGEKLRATFEQGMKDLAEQDKLSPIYAKWKLPMPRMYQK